MRAILNPWMTLAIVGASLSGAGCGSTEDVYFASNVEPDERVDAASSALGVSNPGTFDFWLTDDSMFEFQGSGPPPLGILLGNTTPPFAKFSAGVDASGDISSVSSDFHDRTYSTPCNGTNVTADLEFLSTSTGTADPVEGTLALDAVARVNFQGPGLGLFGCSTSNFVIPATGSLGDGTCGVSGLGTGEFCVFSDFQADGVEVPALEGADCNNQGACLNTYFDLGSSTGSLWIHGQTNPEIQGG